MWRHASVPREKHLQTVKQQGLIFPETDLPDGGTVPYWNESAWYEFTGDEVEVMEKATEQLWGMCLEAVPRMLRDLDDDALRLPRGTLEHVRASIRREDPSVYGRFDLRYDGMDLRMMELNGDTPTGLVETAVAQWHWKEDLAFSEDTDQWNSLHERLVDRWAELARRGRVPGHRLHLFHSRADTSGEEEMTTHYMADAATQAGLTVSVQPIELIQWNEHVSEPGRGRFLDANGEEIRAAFKLYPWESMLEEDPVAQILLSGAELVPVHWVEPAWKVLLSTKALLPVLWEMWPECPYLLPAYFDEPRDLDQWIAKPLRGREGDNIVVHRADGTEIVRDGAYAGDRMVYQQFVELPNFGNAADGDNYAMVGSWVVDGEAAGGIVRESDGPVTDYFSRVVPHVISDALEPAYGQQLLWRTQRVSDNLPHLDG